MLMLAHLLLGLTLPQGSQHARPYPCLPANILLTTVVSGRPRGTARPQDSTVTVQDTLRVLHAQCRKGRLMDGAGKGIRFYRLNCFGAPTRYAMETMRREREELAALRRRYTVIALSEREPCA